jgi:phytoene dehydrogenase-like protein
MTAESMAGGQGTCLPAGGMGAVADALAGAAQAAGATLRTGARVARILVKDDRAAGVLLDNGETLAAHTVISNADPRNTFLRLLGTEHLDTGFVRRIDHFRSKGLTAKLHVALSGPPPFRGLDGDQLKARLLIAPSPEYIEEAYNHSKYGEYSSAPALEITVPTAGDPNLAPAGRHILSIIAQYAPTTPVGDPDAERGAFIERIFDVIESYAPGVRALVVATELLTPLDIEREFGMSGGHWHHGELAFDQFFMVRPVPGAAQYRTPVPGLFLCGAGNHPGGGIMGIAGRLAAHEILKR